MSECTLSRECTQVPTKNRLESFPPTSVLQSPEPRSQTVKTEFLKTYMFFYGKEDVLPIGCELRSFKLKIKAF